MADEDKLLGLRGSDRVFASHRIDIETTADIRFTDDGTDRFADVGAVKSPVPDHADHTSKAGYSRKVLVEDVATRDAVTSYLDGAGIGYVVESIPITQAERDAIAEWGAEIGVDVPEALGWDQAVSDVDAGTIPMSAYLRGENPNTGSGFTHPKRRENR